MARGVLLHPLSVKSRRFLRQRDGTTLVELLLFMTIVALVGASILPIFYASTDNRLLQQTIAIVEQNGTQLLQNVSYRIRNAERVLDPPLGETGSVLALQTGSGAIDPVLIGINSGSLVILRHTTKQYLSASQVALQDFVVRNTSTSTTRNSVMISFRVSRTIRLRAPRTYSKTYTALFTLPPVDSPADSGCSCTPPTCSGTNRYAWDICQEGTCYSAETDLDCYIH